MSRGFIVVMTAFMSVLFLNKRKQTAHWIAIAIVFLGITIVGLSGYLASNEEDPGNTLILIIGLLMILSA